MRVSAEITAICITIEDDEQRWGPEVVETMARIAGDQALVMYNCVGTMDALTDYSDPSTMDPPA